MTSTIVAVVSAVAVVGMLSGLLIYIGWQAAADSFRHDREQLQQQREALDAEWQALDNTRRVREVFWTARRAMQGSTAARTGRR